MKKYLLILVLFASCATQKKAEKYYEKHPEELAQVCIDKFPLDTVSKTDTFYQKADNVDYSNAIDSLVAYGTILTGLDSGIRINVNDTAAISKYIDTINSQVKKLKANYKPCKPDTVRLTNTITVEDKRKLFIVQNDLDKEKKAHNKTIIGKHIFMWWAIVATVIGLFFLMIIIKHIKI
jgi:hypothetical protein